jgi:hypothetical protein
MAVVEKAWKAFIELPYVAPVQGSVIFTSADPSGPRNYIPDPDVSSGEPQPRYIFSLLFVART